MSRRDFSQVGKELTGFLQDFRIADYKLGTCLKEVSPIAFVITKEGPKLSGLSSNYGLSTRPSILLGSAQGSYDAILLNVPVTGDSHEQEKGPLFYKETLFASNGSPGRIQIP